MDDKVLRESVDNINCVELKQAHTNYTRTDRCDRCVNAGASDIEGFERGSQDGLSDRKRQRTVDWSGPRLPFQRRAEAPLAGTVAHQTHFTI